LFAYGAAVGVRRLTHMLRARVKPALNLSFILSMNARRAS
jgi:hypothetical protein